MDSIDHITDLEQGLLDLRLKVITCRVARPSASFCSECGNPLPALRRKTLPGVQLCVGCQEVSEVSQRNFGGRV